MVSGLLGEAGPTGKGKGGHQANLFPWDVPCSRLRNSCASSKQPVCFYLMGHGIQGLVRLPSSHWPPENSEPRELAFPDL